MLLVLAYRNWCAKLWTCDLTDQSTLITGCKKWDSCAPEAILHALGGKLTDIKGDLYKYHTGVEVTF